MTLQLALKSYQLLLIYLSLKGVKIFVLKFHAHAPTMVITFHMSKIQQVSTGTRERSAND